MVGGAHHHDPMLERLAEATGLTVVSTYYRLAPEHTPTPAAPDDCEAAAMWLHRHAPPHPRRRFGGGRRASRLELTLLLSSAFVSGTAMVSTPSARPCSPTGRMTCGARPPSGRLRESTPILTTSVIRWFTEQFAGGHDLTDPDISPIFADLRGMPPALFTVGTIDPLYDDSLFMFSRVAQGR